MATEKRLIDANALMDAFRKHMAWKFDRERCVSEDNCKTCDRGCLWRNIVMDAPTVDAVEVVHGYNTGNARWFECSVCGYGFNDIFLLDEADDMLEPNYCAHCGAKMDLEAGHD